MKEIEKQKILKSLFCSDADGGKENEDTPTKKSDGLDNTDYEIV